MNASLWVSLAVWTTTRGKILTYDKLISEFRCYLGGVVCVDVAGRR